MKIDEAKKIIASYVVGEAVARRDLDDAWETLRLGDQDHLDYLDEELGLQLETFSLCDLFAERVAEYGELTPAEREKEMGELVRHLSSCATCRNVYRDVYMSAFAEGAAWAGEQIRRLAEPIQLILDWGGKLTSAGLGPSELKPADKVAGSMARTTLGGQSPTGPKEWEVRLDDERDVRILIAAEGILIADEEPSGQRVAIRFELRQGGAKIPATSMRMECYETTLGGAPLLKDKDRLTAYVDSPLVLNLGSWLIRLISDEGTRWEIPVVLNHIEVDE